MYKKIDIIIPNYNNEEFLDKSIGSVLKQSFKNWKIYVVDDNSTDNSRDILKKYKKNKKIKIFYLKKNMGPSYSRNYAISKSKSELIAFLDSDDFWAKDKLKKQINFMKRNKLAFTFTDYIPFFSQSDRYLKATNIDKSLNYNQFIHNSSIGTSTMIVKRSIIKNIRFKNTNIMEDYIFKCEILRKKKIISTKLNEPLVYYRLNKGSRNSNKFKNIFYLWKLNSKYNNLNILQNFFSILMISINSLKKYGFK
tara:strand:+ start:1282 stop:2037 length:756 start_codon:yes stop_codon:yes gene_type:complete